MFNDNIFLSVSDNLISFIENSNKSTVSEIQTAVLLTGINLPDYAVQFTSFSKKIQKSITPHVVCLQPENCQTVKSLVENVVYEYIMNTSMNNTEVNS